MGPTIRIHGTSSFRSAGLATALLLSSAVAAQESDPGDRLLEETLRTRLELAAALVEEGRFRLATERLDSLAELFDRLGDGATGRELAATLSEKAREGSRLSTAGEGDEADPDSLEARVSRWVRLLGDDEWAERERASRELALLGPEAIPFVERALGDPDPEVDHRAEEALAALKTREGHRPFRFVLGKIIWTRAEGALVDVGSESGLGEGMEGVSFRPGEFGVRLRVEEVRRDWAVLRVTESLSGGEARPGDLAEFSREFEDGGR